MKGLLGLLAGRGVLHLLAATLDVLVRPTTIRIPIAAISFFMMFPLKSFDRSSILPCIRLDPPPGKPRRRRLH
jgi:hypothetical protein